MSLDLTAFDAVLKDIYLGPIREQLNKSTVLMSRIEKTGDYIDASGKKAVIPVLLGFPQGIGARADGGALPQAGNSVYVDSNVTVKHNYLRIQISGPTMRASKSNAGAFAKAVDSEIKNGLAGFKRDINRQMFNDGTGKMALVDGDVAASTTIVTTDTSNLAAGMYIDIYLAAAQEADSVKIVTVDSTTNITVDSAVTCTDASYIYREDSYGTVEMMGLKGIVDDASYVAILQGITRADYPLWNAKSYDNAGTPRALTLALMQAPFTYVEKTGLGPTAIISTYGFRDKYVTLVQADKRFVNTMKLDGGFEAVEFNGKPLIPDEQATTKTAYFLAESRLAIHRQSDFNWADEDGSVLKNISGYDAYEAFLYYDAEFASDRPNSMAVLADITE